MLTPSTAEVYMNNIMNNVNTMNLNILSMYNTLSVTQGMSIKLKYILTSNKIHLTGVIKYTAYGTSSDRRITCQHLTLLASHFDNQSAAF